jgi:cyclic-di-AMP phosphodiesterase PgpH
VSAAPSDPPARSPSPRGAGARIAALVLAVLGIPAILGLSALFTDAPIEVGTPAPRTVIAPEEVRVTDVEATDLARRQAAEAVEPVVIEDLDAQSQLIQSVVDAFAVAQSVRAPGVDGRIPSQSQQVEVLAQRLPVLEADAVSLLVGLTDAELATARDEAVAIARAAAASDILPEDVDGYVRTDLASDLARTPVSPEVRAQVLQPILTDAIRPTTAVDQQATLEAREQAAAAITDVEVPFRRGTPIVRAGEVVTPVQMAALQRSGLQGTDPLADLAKGVLLAGVMTAVVALFLRTFRPRAWADGRRLLLLATLVALYAAFVVAIAAVPVGGAARLLLVPVAAFAMLATILFDGRVGVLLVIPMVGLAGYQSPGVAGLTTFLALTGLVSIPLVSDLTARTQLRTAAWRSTLAITALAGALNLVHGGGEGLPAAMAAGLLNGVLTAVVVNGLLPFLESVFGVITPTSLLDFADRNHPLLRELETKAIGTYNHSVMVAMLASRACRAIGADALLAEVMALYHDIGKVTKPYFFVENQVAIANPHDELNDPRQSALIIQRHVTDGVEMAVVHKLPPEIVDGIRTHHGTTLVAYFYRQALQRAEDGLAPEPDEALFRYKGRRPFTREQAVLMLSDCTEGAVRAASSAEGRMSRDTIGQIVRSLIAERVADGQLDDSPLTFADLRTVEQSIVEALEGVYHPRIQYPKAPIRDARSAVEADREVAADLAAVDVGDAGQPEGARTAP